MEGTVFFLRSDGKWALVDYNTRSARTIVRDEVEVVYESNREIKKRGEKRKQAKHKKMITHGTQWG